MGASARATPPCAAIGAARCGPALDGVVTGDPLFSLHYTSSSAEDLGRASAAVSELPSALPQFFAELVKLPVLLAALLGIVVGGLDGAAAGG